MQSAYIEKMISGSNERPGDKPTPSNTSCEGREQGLAAEGAHDLRIDLKIDLQIHKCSAHDLKIYLKINKYYAYDLEIDLQINKCSAHDLKN